MSNMCKVKHYFDCSENCIQHDVYCNIILYQPVYVRMQAYTMVYTLDIIITKQFSCRDWMTVIQRIIEKVKATIVVSTYALYIDMLY